MKFIIDIEDFWLDEDDDIEPALKRHITTSVVVQITKAIEDKVNTEVAEKVTETIEAKLNPVIDAKIIDLMATGMIIKNREPVSIDKHIKNIFEQSMGWNAGEQIKKFAKKFGEEMKLQYNAAFANQIVANMKEQGFLKDDVTQILLGGKDKL